MIKSTSASKTIDRFGRTLVLAASVLSMLLLAGCISSSKVYNNDKNVVYNGTMYNLANVKQIKSTITGKTESGEEINLANADRKAVEALLYKESSVYVRMAFEFDDQEMLYRASNVEKWNQYSKMKKSFESAGKDISSLMANKKKIQLKLK
jgi:hypothetical protein